MAPTRACVQNALCFVGAHTSKTKLRRLPRGRGKSFSASAGSGVSIPLFASRGYSRSSKAPFMNGNVSPRAFPGRSEHEALDLFIKASSVVHLRRSEDMFAYQRCFALSSTSRIVGDDNFVRVFVHPGDETNFSRPRSRERQSGFPQKLPTRQRHTRNNTSRVKLFKNAACSGCKRRENFVGVWRRMMSGRTLCEKFRLLLSAGVSATYVKHTQPASSTET